MQHDEYIKRRDELLKIRTDSFDSFDKAVLSLSTGCLALSVTFLEKIGAPFNKTTYILIFATWVSLFVVILANLLSYLFAKSNMDKKIKELDEYYQAEVDSPKSEQDGDIKPKQNAENIFWQRTATNICNNLAFISFFVSILFFTLYIVAIQRNNYTKLLAQKQEESVVTIKKTTEVTTKLTEITAGKTEMKAPVAQKIPTRGKTEAPAAVPTKATTNISSPSKLVTFGKTEAPRPVQKPATPPAASTSDK